MSSKEQRYRNLLAKVERREHRPGDDRWNMATAVMRTEVFILNIELWISTIRLGTSDPRNEDLREIRELIAKAWRYFRMKDFKDRMMATACAGDAQILLRRSFWEPIYETGLKVHRTLEARRTQANTARHQERSNEWGRWNAAAATLWKPGSTKNSVARILKARLKLADSVPGIARRLRKPRQAS